eukprot:CAMPEP_0202458554 /NCGR_PEP_ID=MMETSP1360-20130828/26443_1 /ASSEMBLY_ACC=CAM_ASM_000848 /TAXON_ID=515479 /ORGANISM="Licmophora paradoxa, Strain CCMP2313" /LENGTH=233 /DNA_ID=CAMNT_0049079153 /DNA_START=16 /DNA_END=717 /DNA_ORIENTATION=-
MKSTVAFLTLAVATTAFTKSAFVGRPSNVCSRSQLNTPATCSPSSVAARQALSMGILQRFGLKKDDNEETSAVSVVESSDKSTTVSVLDAPKESTPNTSATAVEEVKEEEKEKEEMSETQKLMQQVKDAGTAGVISYALWELGFWFLSVPVCIFGYQQVTGHWPDLSNPDDQKQLGAEAFAFVNFARFAVPLRIGLALSTTPWIQSNVVDRFMSKDGESEEMKTAADTTTSED